MCSYMGALGKMMSGSGWEELIIEANICASGSITKVISGKHYNRSLRVHQIVVDAVERLILESFARSKPDIDIHDLQLLASRPSHDSINDCTTSEAFVGLAESLREYRRDIRDGKLGKTAQLWLMYADSVWNLLRFHRAIKENDLQQYIASMRNLCSLLFSADHLNYARYLTYYYHQLMTLDNSHPGAVDLLRANGFSVGRSNIPASRCALDLTIEQTINRAAKTPGGVIGFSRKPATYYRWCVTRHTRASYLQATLDRAHMLAECDYTHRSSRPSELQNSENNVQRVLEAFRQFQNPFHIGAEHQASLLCISSGRPATDDVAEDLVRYVAVGSGAADDFLKTRLINHSIHFQKPIKKLRLKTFQSTAAVKVLTTTQKKTVQVKAERNLLGRLLMLSQTHEISLRKLFKYQLGPIPWSIATADGGMVKTNKSQLLHHLESRATACTPPSLDECVYVVDGNAIIQSCIALPETFGELAQQIFKCLPKSAEVHFLTDCYHQHSIKSFERSRRGEACQYSVGGSKTKVPRDFKSFLANSDNKRQLIHFLRDEWQSTQYAQQLFGRKLYFVCGEECTCIYSTDGLHTASSPIKDLFSSQEEADTRIVLHCQHVSDNASRGTTIIVRSPDTDVLVILLSYIDTFSCAVLFDTGTGNNRRVLDLASISQSIGVQASKALPALHAFTGCDFTSAFVRRGKVKPFQIMEKETRFLAAFKQLGTHATVDGDVLRHVEHFLCALYGKPSYTNVNELRHDLFEVRYQPKSTIRSFVIDDGIDLSLLPPCQSSFEKHAQRANYVAYIWKQSHIPYPEIPSPIGLGWKADAEGKLEIEWNSGDIMPQSLVDVVVSESSDDSTEGVCMEDCEVDNVIDIVFEDDE